MVKSCTLIFFYLGKKLETKQAENSLRFESLVMKSTVSILSLDLNFVLLLHLYMVVFINLKNR